MLMLSDRDIAKSKALEAAFASFGVVVKADDVPRLVEANVDVWSWGYGDSDFEFTTIGVDDLWFFYEEPKDAATAWGPFRADADDVRAVLGDPVATALHALAESAVWEPDGPGARVSFVSFAGGVVRQPIADALDWACVSCRDDVGWVESEVMERDADGSITVVVTCGHCGWQGIWDIDGNRLDT